MGRGDLQNTLGKIIIHKEEMRRDIAYLRQAAGNFRAASGICKRGVDSSRWAGESADIFSERYTQLVKSMNSQADECEGVAKKMEDVINMFEQTERELQSQINSMLPGGNG